MEWIGPIDTRDYSENFGRGNPTLTTFFGDMRDREDPNTTKSGQTLNTGLVAL